MRRRRSRLGRKPRNLIGSLRLVAVLAVALTSRSAEVESTDELLRQATVANKGQAHVVFREKITSRQQSDWTGIYNAEVEVHLRGTNGAPTIRTFRGSTLPNFKPAGSRSVDWQYSVVMATCAFPRDLMGRVYSWKAGSRAKDGSPCLRLAGKVPTIGVGSERRLEAVLLKLRASELSSMAFATDVLVHSGSTLDWRGSAGCLTIHPDDAEGFFEVLSGVGFGTLEVARGIEDATAGSSSCY